MMHLLSRNDALSITQEDKKTDAPRLLFFSPLPDEQKPLLPVQDQPANQEPLSWWRNMFCCK